MQIINLVHVLKILSLIVVVNGQFKYDIEYIEERIFLKCDDYPDNYLDQAFDMSDLIIRQTEDGNLIVKGSFIVTKTLPDGLRVTTESFKKERGTWQPTIYTAKRPDFCKASFDSSEIWHPYWKNSPQEQLSCPFTEGQRIDMDISADSSLNLPMRNIEGEYLSRLEIGDKTDDDFMCAIVLVNVHKV